MEELARYLKALVLLQLEEHKEDGERLKPELLLNRAGFQHKEIAEILDKKTGAVAMSIRRAKKP